ncbi:MAG: DUF4923 family protein [Muribaculaceae bacterium]|nr:DUF4923 family protein [Bacteroidales bacterium]MBD5303625.1 DUF4923 family protein [Bacteroides sp.]MBD5340532.1 DUF4923 family protein [Bacteroides sp.]MDE6072045.1 DUF4923 family protein [Muribaculaceae bacterium]
MKLIKKLALVAAVIFACSNMTNAQSLSDLLGKLGGSGDAASTIGNLVEGVLSKSDLKVSDLQGTWTAKGPAVSFKGDNFLKQAGGAAASAAIETKLQPYYTKFGLTGAVLTVNNDGTFQLTIKKLKLSGTVEQPAGSEKGTFVFNFKAAGKIKLGKITTYVQKTSNSMDVMFDATKLMTIIEAVAKYSNISMAKTLSSLLSSYDGMCVGFAMNK